MAEHVRARARLVPILLWLLICTAVQGAETAYPYGRDYALAGALPVVALGDAPLPEPVDAAQARAAAARLESQVEELTFRDGPYAASLSEPLGDLARQLDNLGLSNEAVRLRERALHVLRVNEGLYTASQVPVLRMLMTGDRQRNDYRALDQRYSYLFRLHGSGRPPFTDERVRVALEYLRWQREAVLRVIDGEAVVRLLSLHSVSSLFFDELLAEPQAEWPWLRDAGLSQLKTLYLVAVAVDPDTDAQGLGGGLRASPVEREIEDFFPQRQRVLSLARGLRARGRDLLEQLLERAPDGVEKARLLREQGDWQLWLGLPNSARDLYRRSHTILAKLGDESRLKRWFSIPRPLPDNGVFLDAAVRDGVPLRAGVTVDARGRVREATVQELSGATRERRRLSRALRATHFRPVINAAGEATGAEFEARYLLYKQALPQIDPR